MHGKYLDDKNQKINVGSFATQGAKDKLINDLNELAVSTQRAGGGNPIALFNLAYILTADLQKKEAPEAYLIYALYDQDSNRYEVGKKVLTKNAANQHEELKEKLAIKKNGYIETFVVNETGQDVWFDNMMVMSVSSVIVQETHYDPWGLELTGLGFQYGGIKANKYLYNGKELIEDNGLQYYDYGARMYDPAIGRWGVVDPLADSYQAFSPYNYTLNNPIAFTDPNGMWVEGQNGSMFTDDPDDISKFFQAVGDFFHNLLIPSQTEEGNEKQQATWATVGRVSKTVNDLHDLQKDVLEVAPGGFLGSALMDTQTGNFSGEEFAQNIAYEAGSGFIFGKVIGKAVAKGVSVIGPRASYREFAKTIGANFLDVTDEAWTMRKNVQFLQGVVKRGDDVVFSSQYNPARLDPKSVLAQEIRYLQKHGYSWTKDFSRMTKK